MSDEKYNENSQNDQLATVEVLSNSLDALADNIAALSEIGKMIDKSKLKRKTIVMLLARMSNIKQADVEIILHNLSLLEKEYLK